MLPVKPGTVSLRNGKTKMYDKKDAYAQGGMAKKKKKKKGYAKGGMVKTGHADRKDGMFYKSESPRGYK